MRIPILPATTTSGSAPNSSSSMKAFTPSFTVIGVTPACFKIVIIDPLVAIPTSPQADQQMEVARIPCFLNCQQFLER